MGFYLERYLAAFREHRHWMFVALVPVALYLIVAALRVDSFAITQDFTYSGDIRLAITDSPIETLSLETLLADPKPLFFDPAALSRLQQRIELQQDAGTLPTGSGLKRAVHATLRLTRASDARLRLTYEGFDSRLGRLLVGFYGEQLVERIAAGAAQHTAAESSGTYSFQADGDLRVLGVATPWSSERLPRALLIGVLSLLTVLLLIGVLELSDPAFKSERQVARYLDLPVLGSMPDADRLARCLVPTMQGLKPPPDQIANPFG